MLLKNQYKIMLKNFKKELNNIINLPYYKTSVKKCIIYCPHVNNGICRYCDSKEYLHKFKKKFIENLISELM